MYQPKFRYWTIVYTYPDGYEVRAGAYADRAMAQMNANLNPDLEPAVCEVWY